MAAALKLAARGLYTTHPNPRVGCVLVSNGKVVGRGFHQKAGEPHAERIALAEAGVDAKGATAYVTLEPCSHQGRTGPCANALIEAGVGRVVAAMEDPNPLVSGRGLARLRESGVEVQTGVMAYEAGKLNAGFVKRMAAGRPLVRCKLAMSLDGRTAMASGESKWITGEAARRDVQRLRARSDATVTGIGTVLADDPEMNVRISPPGSGVSVSEVRQPLRVVLDPLLEISPSARLLTAPGTALVLCTASAKGRQLLLQAEGIETVCMPGEAGALDLGAVMDYLVKREINEILIESGSTLAGAALAAGLVDELVIYCAPHVLGDSARGLFHLPALVKMRERIELVFTDVRMVGKDIRICATPVVDH